MWICSNVIYGAHNQFYPHMHWQHGFYDKKLLECLWYRRRRNIHNRRIDKHEYVGRDDAKSI